MNRIQGVSSTLDVDEKTKLMSQWFETNCSHRPVSIHICWEVSPPPRSTPLFPRNFSGRRNMPVTTTPSAKRPEMTLSLAGHMPQPKSSTSFLIHFLSALEVAAAFCNWYFCRTENTSKDSFQQFKYVSRVSIFFMFHCPNYLNGFCLLLTSIS